MKMFTLLKTMLLATIILLGSAGMFSQTTYQLVTSASDLEAGARYVISSSATNGSAKAMQSRGSGTNNNQGAVDVTITNMQIVLNDTDEATPFYLGGDASGWTFSDGNYYLTATNTTSSNYLKTTTTLDNYCYFSISFSANDAVITCTGKSSRNLLRYNSSNNPPLFSCYNSGQNPVYLYKEVLSTTQVATPVFEPASGEYFNNPLEISIVTPTDDATIHYTTDGSTPDENSIEYSGPFNITEAVTIKAIAVKEGMENSEVATATYTFVAPIDNLADIRAKGDGATVKYLGTATVTFATEDRNAKYIQDATGAILIDDNNGAITGSYDIGEGITNITGTLSDYNGMLQFVPSEDAEKTVGSTISPEIKTIDNLSVNDQAKLVKLENITFSGTGNFARGVNAEITGTSSVVVRPQYSDLDYIGNPIPTTAQDVTAVVLVFGTSIQLVPRSSSDIVDNTGNGTGVNLIENINLYTANGQIHFTAAAGENVEIYNSVGQLIYKGIAVEGLNSIAVTSGVTLVKVGNEINKVVVK